MAAMSPIARGEPIALRPRPSDERPAFSVVAPCYNEEETLPVFVARMVAACQAVAGDSFELLLVNDGSRDGTWVQIQAMAGQHPGVVGVNLARNYGHQLAVTAGLKLARGQRVLIIDADLQDPPELLTELKAYRRISGRVDQNHLIADTLRALGRPGEAVPLAEEELRGAAPNDAKAEAVIVAASALADQGRWAETPGGYYWVSYDPWNPVTYHYGDWRWHDVWGWLWYPGWTFAP